MFLRLRWFVVGALASLGVMSYLAAQVKRARERLTPRNLANSGLRGVAGLLDSAADAVNPTSETRR